MIDTDKYERMLKDDDGRNNVLALDLLAEVKRLKKVLVDAFKFVCEEESVWDAMQEHLDHWSDINHMFDVTGHDECGCVDCCEAEGCPDVCEMPRKK